MRKLLKYWKAIVATVGLFVLIPTVFAAQVGGMWKRTGTGNEITPININGSTADVVVNDITIDGTCTGCGASGATTALDNLASTAVNTDIISDTDGTDSLGSTGIRWLKGWFDDLEVTNEPTVGGTALSALTQTLTNKAITQRVVTTTDDSTAVIDIDVTDVYELSAVANATVFTLTGTPTDGQKLIVRYKDAGVSKGLTWTGFTALGITLPTDTTAGKWDYVGCTYNLGATAWHCIATVTEA